jgi:hypothetical protein
VEPGEAVRRSESGAYRVAPQSPPVGEERTSTMSEPEDLVLTPGGYRPASQVHEIAPDHTLRVTDESIQELDPSGEVVAEYPAVPESPDDEPLMPENVSLGPSDTPAAEAVPAALGEGWIAYASWFNDTGRPVTTFRATWTVPPAPSTNSGQTIFLFNGIESATWIVQPVLQWGPSDAGGGRFWTVASWLADGASGPAFYSPLRRVTVGQNLVGEITLTGTTGPKFTYNCKFLGIPFTSFNTFPIFQLKHCVVTLEAYNPVLCSNYPATSHTSFRGIEILTGTTHPALSWTPTPLITDCGQNVTVVSNANPGGQVDIHY